ncbi:MAG: hypothetical protein IPL83_09145 [Bdellovibrionales bacterium]|nr:hypothetical protein [Bdellovibrionales bacterium]
MDRFIKFNLVAIGIVVSGCSSNFLSSDKISSGGLALEDEENLDAGITNQAPKISCLLSNLDQPTQTRVIDTVGEKDSFFSSYPVEGQRVSFDCSKTQDETPNSLSYFIDTDYDPASPSWTALSGQIVLDAGRKPMAIKAVDGAGLVTIKAFAIDSQCADGDRPVITAATVNITATNRHNYYNFSAAGAVTGGTGFQYAWDFNGDSVFDPYPLRETSGSTWVDSPAANNVYSIFASADSRDRKAFLRVRNACNLESDTVAVDLPDELPNIERTLAAQAVPKPYYYLQADISGLGPQAETTSMFQRVNGPYLATQYPGEAYRRVVCSYDLKTLAGKGRFTIQGFNWYQGDNSLDLSDEFLHGMEIRISNIPDNGGQAAQTYNQSAGVILNNALYKASAASDGLVSESYNRIDTACAVEITIERAQGVLPCAQNTDQVAFEPQSATILLGEFNCPSLTNTRTNRAVAANNGKFFCEVAPVDQCVGGGGGGGGGIPPREQ